MSFNKILKLRKLQEIGEIVIEAKSNYEINDFLDWLNKRKRKIHKMQTQLEQMNKRSKITVPFYSPPSRLYGQTPAEIIKEARAAVLKIPAVGIKPVFTSRPFTPKEKERTLFGNVKRRSSRPPSSFSLKNVNSLESGPRLKLPSIETFSKKKVYSKFQYSNNLSLDNLTEDYDAEALEEIEEIERNKLPKWKKAHSCPKEGRMVKASSYNELRIQSFSEETGSRIKFENPKTDLSEKSTSECKSDNIKNTSITNKNDPGSSTSDVIGDSIKAQNPDIHSLDFYQNLNLTQGGGDYEEFRVGEKFKESQKDGLSGEKNYDLILNQRDINQLAVNKKEKRNEEQVQKKLEKNEKFEIDGIVSSEAAGKLNEINKCGESKIIENDHRKMEQEMVLNKTNRLLEKSAATEPKSDYLLAVKEGFTNNNLTNELSKSMPLEILELYETANYYGIKVDGSDTEISYATKNKKEIKSPPNANVKLNEKCSDYISLLQESSDKIKEKIKSLSEVEEKMSKNLSSKMDEKIAENLSDDLTFTMNNKTRYHITSDKVGTKEKAYKKWKNKQEMFSNTQSQLHATTDGSWDLFWKNSYFKEREDDSDNLANLEKLICKLASLIKIGPETSVLYETITQLYNLIKSNKIAIDGKLKKNILKALYLYVDNENPEIVLSLARLLLFLKVESSLPVAFKMIFKVARFDTNDHLFLNEDILELFLDGIGRSSPLESAESCIYGYGALKFLTMNSNILNRILCMGALDLMTLHMKIINTAFIENGSVEEQTQHTLFQLTGALRHVAAGEGAMSLFLTTNCIYILCKSLQLFYKDDDIVTNISRTLSLLSPNENVTQVLMSVENILNTLIELIERYKENDKILIRLSYCLGNIVEYSDLARVQLSRNDASFTTLLNVLNLYINKDLEISLKGNILENAEDLSTETVDDVIVKVIRIIANMSMNPIVGSNFSPATNEKKSLQLSKLLSVLLMRKDPGIVLLATLGCLNNISYYCNTHSALIDITQGVERVLGLPSEECQTEAARVLGNLTRHKEIRELIFSTGGISQLMKLITNQDQEIVRCACGALVNMMLDSETRKKFLKDHGVDKLIKAMEIFSGDWALSSLAARAIWNSCADDLSSAMLNNNIEHLQSILANSLEEENWNDGDIAWEEFASIATDLLEKINSHLESQSF